MIPFDPDSIVAAEPAAALPTPAAEPPARGMAAPLDKADKWRLSDLAKRAFARLQATGQANAGESLAAFRQRVSIEACGRRISQACLADKGAIQAAFLSLMGNARAATHATAKALATPEAIALNALRRNLAERRLSMAYAESIAARVFKRPIRDLHAKEIWQLVYTTRTNHKPVKA